MAENGLGLSDQMRFGVEAVEIFIFAKVADDNGAVRNFRAKGDAAGHHVEITVSKGFRAMGPDFGGEAFGR